jgi:hypothetical protein
MDLIAHRSQQKDPWKYAWMDWVITTDNLLDEVRCLPRKETNSTARVDPHSIHDLCIDMSMVAEYTARKVHAREPPCRRSQATNLKTLASIRRPTLACPWSSLS